MESVRLRAMTPAEYQQWRPRAVADYAEHHARAGSMPAEHARELAEKQFTELLPDGVSTPDHHVLIPQVGERAVGLLWLHIPTGPRPSAFVYDVEVDEGMRGRGLGRAIMVAAEEYARQHGAVSMRLHVFGDNIAARGLYDSLGYRATNVMMAKPLETTSD